MAEMKQGLVALKAPIELTVKKHKYRLELKNKNDDTLRYIQWDDYYITSDDVEAIKEFAETVYRAGFADGSVTAMNK